MLERLKQRWADGMLTDHEGFEITPSSPVLDPGLYDYKGALPGECCKTACLLCARDCKVVMVLDVTSPLRSLHGIALPVCIDILQSTIFDPCLRYWFWSVTPAFTQSL